MRAQLIAALSACLVGGLVALPASAEPAYRASQIVDFFAPAQPALGASRGLCVGTEAECGMPTPKKNLQSSFNLVVNFQYNSDQLTEAAKKNLDEFAKALQDPRLAASAFAVEGYTDAKGSPGYNLSLSERRADAVVKYLRQKGADTAKLEARGFGEQKPIGGDPLDPANRRVETRLLPSE